MRKRLNLAYLKFYGLVFLLLGVVSTYGMLSHSLQAARLTIDYKPTRALAVRECREKSVWVKYAYTVEGRDYLGEESIWFFTHQELDEAKLIEIYYSPSHPELSCLDRPTLPRLLWTLVKDAFVLMMLLSLCLVGAVGMLFEGAQVSNWFDERERLKKIKSDVDACRSPLSQAQSSPDLP